MSNSESIQELLDREAYLSNSGQKNKTYYAIHKRIRELRADSETPCCFGHDDCSTLMLSMCPWRIDCGE